MWIAYIRQPLCVRLRKTRRQAAVRETSAASAQEDEFCWRGRARLHWSGSQWLNVGATRVHRSQVSMSQTINQHPQTPYEDTFQWTGEPEKALGGEQSRDWGSSISKRRGDRQIQPFMWLFHPVNNFIWVFLFISVCLHACLWLSAGSSFMSLYSITAVSPITEKFDVCLGNSEKNKLVLLNSFSEIVGFYSWGLFWVQMPFLFLQRVTGWTNLYRLVG